MTYDQWFEQYLALYKRRIAPKTRESYTHLHSLISASIGSMELDIISPDDLQAALLAIEDGAGSRQAQLAYALIHAALRRACRSRRLQYNPADAIDKPDHEATAGRAIMGSDWELLRPVIDDELAFCLMARAGLRRGEVLGLQWGDVDLQRGVIRVRRSAVRVGHRLQILPTKSRSGMRDVPIVPELAVLLRRSFRLAPAMRVIGCSPETLGRRWRRAQECAGVAQPYRLHDLRHTYATRMISKGCNPRVLQYMIGHSTLDLTMQTYTHIDASIALQEVNRLAASLH